ncbi:MAG TPA: glycosyltransferase family 39 protein [Pyrinomonadaceae bacterium]|jgi:4-amino-4-deoxy-L-arabinose transferase-like glycosyltransferase
MALGRSLFIFGNHALWRAAHAVFNLPAADAYLVFKYAVIIECPLAVLACWTLARDLLRSLEAATIAALMIATAPAFVVYGGQVMTEIPSLLLLAGALVIHLRGTRSERVWMILAGAALLGLGVNVRETVAFYAPWLVIAPFVCGPTTRAEGRRRKALQALLACLIFVVFAFGPFLLWFTIDEGFRASWYGWRESMRMESARHPVAFGNLFPFLLYFFLAAPPVFLALPFAFVKEWRTRGLTCLLALSLVGLLADFLLIFNYSTVVNWRYFLTGLPALAPLAADGLLRWRASKSGGDARRAFLHIALALSLMTVAFGVYAQLSSRAYVAQRALTRDYSARLRLLPGDAVVIAGGQTVAVTYYRGIGLGAWEVIGTGGGWPGEQLVPLIERYLQQGRRVFLDSDPRWWSVCGWQLEETRAIAALESRFHFRRLSDTIFELRPITDVHARDAPNLQRLLPENRPADVGKCTRARMKAEGGRMK